MRAHRQSNAPVVERDIRLRILVTNSQQVATTPEIVRLPLDELARRFACLLPPPQLLLPNPAEFADGEGSHHFRRVSSGATSVTRPLGGCTDRCACLTDLRVTLISMLPSWMISLMRTRPAA